MVRWLDTPRKLTREQLRVLNEAIRRNERVAVSAVTLLEIAALGRDGARTRIRVPAGDFLEIFESNPVFQIVPIDVAIAKEVALMGRNLVDPADRAIVATARVHRLKLITSDDRIIESGLVPVVT